VGFVFVFRNQLSEGKLKTRKNKVHNKVRNLGDPSATMLNTFVVYAKNKPDILARVVLLFHRRGFDIDSLTFGKMTKPNVSRITITLEAEECEACRLKSNLYNLVNVILVERVFHPKQESVPT
jgi:acetolactate synthase regulatory subunit